MVNFQFHCMDSNEKLNVSLEKLSQYPFNSIVWILEQDLRQVVEAEINLSIPLYGFLKA